MMGKIERFAAAQAADISAKPFDVVDDRGLRRYWTGTVFGERVITSQGHRFGTFTEARRNAERFVAECRLIRSQA